MTAFLHYFKQSGVKTIRAQSAIELSICLKGTIDWKAIDSRIKGYIYRVESHAMRARAVIPVDALEEIGLKLRQHPSILAINNVLTPYGQDIQEKSLRRHSATMYKIKSTA